MQGLEIQKMLKKVTCYICSGLLIFGWFFCYYYFFLDSFYRFIDSEHNFFNFYTYLEIILHIVFFIIATVFLYKRKDMFFSEQSPKLLLYSMLFALVFFGIVFLCSFPVLGNGIEETFWATLRIWQAILTINAYRNGLIEFNPLKYLYKNNKENYQF